MTLIIMVLRKMNKNKWFIIFLTIGLLISSALMSSIPIYTEAVLQKVLVKDLENYQNENNSFPGNFIIGAYAADNTLNEMLSEVSKEKNIFNNAKVKDFYSKFAESVSEINQYTKNKMSKNIPLDILKDVHSYATEPRSTSFAELQNEGSGKSVYSKIQAVSEIENKINIVDGKLPAKEKVQGTYEAMVSEGALNKLKLVINKSYILKDVNRKGYEDITVKIVGVYEPKEEERLYWSSIKPAALEDSLIINEELMLKDFINCSPTQLDSALWYYSFDYHKLTLSNINKVNVGIENTSRELSSIRGSVMTAFPLTDLTKSYFDKEKQLKTMLWSLNVPVIVMLCIYLFMVSKLIIEKEKNEIALLISRGASRVQVVFGYVIEGMILASIAVILGPVLGVLLTKGLGASNGFLEFVNRKALPASLSFVSYKYALLAGGVFLITLLIPAYKASSTSIVEHKRKKTRGNKTVFWEKIFLDFILTAIALYGYYVFENRQKVIQTTVISGSDIQVDPLLFFVPVIFILGIGLLCLRLYPLLLKLIYKAGKKFWTPPIYGTLVQVSRSSSNYQFLMIFMILTLSIGVFSASAARTLNKNAEDRISYKNGAEIVIEPVWDVIDSSKSSYQEPSAASSSKGETSEPRVVKYIEPPFAPFENLTGVQYAAKVFNKEKVWIKNANNSSQNVDLMAIEPYEFGQVAWYRGGLLPYHINEYLNILTSEESSCILSKELSEILGAKVGDNITVSYEGNKEVMFNVYGIVDYWPTQLPKADTTGTKINNPNFIITNLSYIQGHFPKEPYNVWLKLKKDASREELYKSISGSKTVIVSKLIDTKGDIIQLKTSASQLAINGSLTMGFIISGIICFLGFILYWVLALKERSLQFGILRSIGLSAFQLKLMIIWEQLLTSGIAMLLGIGIGLGASKIYVAFFQLSSNYQEQIPPFKVVSYLSDRLKVYGFVCFTLVLGLGILIYLLSKIKISNVIKLGED